MLTDKTVTEHRYILVTSALPYANGPIHIGHMLEYIQTDIWSRFQRYQGNTCYYVCADDAHGTAIMLRAEQEGCSPEQLIAAIKAEHQQDFSDFGIAFDNYHSTHSEENRYYSEFIYKTCRSQGHIVSREITQAFDPQKQLFLADRFIKGTCPKCHTPDQYGDNCEACGATYTPAELIQPRSAISGATPISRKSSHFFFKLSNFTELLQQWIRAGHLQTEIANKLAEWLDAGLQEWDISRDAPYFGFAIPDAPNKFFYVWLDAPIGYMASFKNLCDRTPGLEFDQYWQADSQTELVHFIGKDIINFHGLFWPAMLSCAGFRTPTRVYAHGFLTVNGQKMSKSRGTFIKARTYLNHLNPEYLRYYFAARLSSKVDDLDLNLDDFAQRVNADLVGKVVNIASRCASFISRGYNGRLSASPPIPELLHCFSARQQTIADYYERREFSKVVREVMELADLANQYIAEQEPWVLVRQVGQEQTVQDICSTGINLFRILMIYLKPIVPNMAADSEYFLQDSLQWQDLDQPLLNHVINPFKPLITRIDRKLIIAMQTEAKAELTKEQQLRGDIANM